MKLHQKILTAVLLVMIGIVMGMAYMLLRGYYSPFTPTKVAVTEVMRSAASAETAPEVTGFPAFSVRDIAQMVVPTVVYIETSVNARAVMPRDENHNFEEDFWERVIPRGRSNAVGSGVLISGDGFIITNNHVVAGGRDLRVTLHDKRQFPARIVGRDPSTDLAVIKIEGDELPHIVLGDSDYVEVGDWVMAVGNPLRLRSTITAGIVSALSRDVQIINDRMRIESFIQTDAAINRGNSGGALVNTAGELIGINTAIATENGMNQGYGFAIPINMAFKIARDLMEFGQVQRAFLGVSIVSVDQRRARQLDMPRIKGVEISGLVTGGAAEVSGLRQGDVITRVNRRTVNEPNELQAQIALFRPNETVEISVWRNGAEEIKFITLAGLDNPAISEWTAPEASPEELMAPFGQDFRGGPFHEGPDHSEPEGEGEEEEDRNVAPEADSETGTGTEPYTEEEREPATASFDRGFSVTELHIEAHRQLGLQLMVTQVRRFSEARRAGLRTNDIVLAINGLRVENVENFEQMMQAAGGSKIELMVMRGATILQIQIE
ncbi:MAG: trypsin-like peptidase domain-containing protein [Candidatus Cyclonatronum sp.]|uniref:trypsin-like peptidase domain-containing protein n=1 Tax=Cyclonatronum sp. TaxID=3024185 RepID=UPI0025C67622|nr:trypsin-like peptidase domain-containing protein [Cyclonatronum sp.]MCH8486472.1 trypsin-like peptidase domain-containing protein [Cyclonatronum sp.]